MSNFDLQMADVFEKLADYLEASENAKEADATAVRTKMALQVAQRLSETTGEELDADAVEKLASADPAVMQILEKIAGGDAPDELGGPEDKRTVKTASAGAMGPGEAALIDFCTS
jgi:hypothetical protein